MELRPTFSEVFFFSSSVLSLLLKCIKKVHSGWTPIYLILLRFMIVCHICSSSWPLNTLVLIMRRTLGNFFSPYFAVPQYWLIYLQIQFLVLLSPIVCLLPHFLTSFSCSTSRRQICSYSVTSSHQHEPKCPRYVSSTDLNLSRRIKAVMKINGLLCHGSKVYPIKLIYVSLGCHQLWLSAASLLSVMFTRLNMLHWTLQHLIKAQLHWCITSCKNYEDKHIWKSTFLWKTNL